MDSQITKVLVVDDEPVVRHVCQLSLAQEQYAVFLAENGMQAMEQIRVDPEITIILSDLKMPGITGLELLHDIKRDFPHVEVIIITGYASIESAIEAMKLGAYDFLLKPLTIDQIRLVVNKCREKIALGKENLALKRANEKLRELQLAKDKFIAITSHELRTPVSHLKGYLTIFNGEYFHSLSSEEKNDCMRVITSAVLDLEQIVTDMIDLVSLEPSRFPAIKFSIEKSGVILKREHFNINDTLEYITHEFRLAVQERQQTLAWRPCPQIQSIYADRGKIKVMVGELIQNAIKFTPNGGTIDLSLQREDNYGVISVHDTGVGIEAHELGRIFEKFYEVQNSDHHSSNKTAFMGGGLGLGLSLARAIAEAHGGGIKVRSEPNKGSLFQIYLPIENR